MGAGTDKSGIDLYYDGSELSFQNNYALSLDAGIPASYATCSTKTGYSTTPVQLEDIQVGEGICVKTDENR